MEKINNIISFHKDVKPELIVKCRKKGGLKEETSSEIPVINVEEGEIEQSIMRSLEEGCSKLVLEDYATEETVQTDRKVKMRTTALEKIPTLLNLKLRSQKKLRLY